MSFCPDADRPRLAGLRSCAPLGQKHWYLALGLLLIARVRRMSLDGSLPPDLAFLAAELTRRGVEAVRAILHQQLRIALRLRYQTGCVGLPPWEPTMAYLPSCSTRIKANFLILPLLRPRVVKITIGLVVPASVLASRPSVAS